jgi:hypothetical protein
VLGPEEDAADGFAAIIGLKMGTAMSQGVLIEAAKGWFYSDRRDSREGNKIAFYDEHGIDKQRAYNVVCLMVGSDPEKFKDLAEATKLPEERQATCVGDYSNASWSWDTVLKPHRRAPDQPKTTIGISYRGEGQACRLRRCVPAREDTGDRRRACVGQLCLARSVCARDAELRRIECPLGHFSPQDHRVLRDRR